MTTTPDLERMKTDRLSRVRDAMAAQDVGALVLLHGPHVGYATGQVAAPTDAGHAVMNRPIAIVTHGSVQVIADHWPDLDEGMKQLGETLSLELGELSGSRVAVDGLTGPMLRAGLLTAPDVADAGAVIAAAKLIKTTDELACIEAAQRLNSQAMLSAQEACVPGATRAQVAAAFLNRLRELGNTHNCIDPIFQTMPRTRTEGTRTNTGDVAFPTGVGNATYEEGDLVWVDSGIAVHGYASDFGRTWIAGRAPNPAEQAIFDRWQAVMAASYDAICPGASLGDVGRAAVAANGGVKPWLPHFYLAHGIGIESAEMPFIGTDLGAGFDDSFILAPGMVLVLEPVVWEDGVGSYRAEEIVAVTDDGWTDLGGGHTYAPFER